MVAMLSIVDIWCCIVLVIGFVMDVMLMLMMLMDGFEDQNPRKRALKY